MKKRSKPTIAELKAHQKRVDSHGRSYELTVSEKQGNDGVEETHLSYEPLFRPKGTKTRGNYTVGVCLPTCKCPYHKGDKK